MLLFDLFRASPCWLAALWLLQVQANLVAFRVLPMLQNGVSVLGSRWGGQPACFALSRLRLFLFEARLSGYCVREGGGVKGVNPGFLVLAFSTRTLKSSGVPARRVPAGACA